jgi:hypothetical protein
MDRRRNSPRMKMHGSNEQNSRRNEGFGGFEREREREREGRALGVGRKKKKTSQLRRLRFMKT